MMAVIEPEQQINTFEEMYYHLKTPGVYLIEDIELNYREDKNLVTLWII
jgi:hypothetical protein